MLECHKCKQFPLFIYVTIPVAKKSLKRARKIPQLPPKPQIKPLEHSQLSHKQLTKRFNTVIQTPRNDDKRLHNKIKQLKAEQTPI